MELPTKDPVSDKESGFFYSFRAGNRGFIPLRIKRQDKEGNGDANY
jgi:hypothetical protein